MCSLARPSLRGCIAPRARALLMPCRPRVDARVARRQLCTKPSAEATAAAADAAPVATGLSYGAFARAYPITNNFVIATAKTSAADLLAQMALEKKSLSEVDWQRNMLFCLFGFVYLGGFQYWYQVNVFKRLFPSVERFTSQSIAAKLTDVPGLLALGAQTVLDVGMLSFCYLPVFYIFKAAVFSEVVSVQAWVSNGMGSYFKNCWKDWYDVVRVWAPADIVCFSVPLWLRLPVRHIVSFVWTAYLSFVRGKK